MELLKRILDTFEDAFQSKKFWYAIGTLFVLFFSDSIGINDQEINNVVLIALALIIAQGLADKKCNR
jgi:hypothetical protein|tara:strand:- start:7391 stop:7591 length:201 start_codon:yes stop_codon:yes gene_type:complete